MPAKKIPPFVVKLKKALQDRLKKAGIEAKIESEPVEGTKLYRFIVLARKFKSMSHTERQGLVWRIAEQELSPEENLLVSMIMTLTPAETGQKVEH